MKKLKVGHLQFEPREGARDKMAKYFASKHARLITDAANKGDEEAIFWLDDLIRRGPSLAFLKRLGKAVDGVKKCSTVRLDERRKRFIWVALETSEPNSVAWPMSLVSAVNAGLAERIKRCARKDCGKFLFGDPRKKWCSDNCGSLVRNQKKRRLARERQSYESRHL